MSFTNETKGLAFFHCVCNITLFAYFVYDLYNNDDDDDDD